MQPKDILQLESSDTRQAYLFEENGRWYAYEHSAKSRNRPQYIGKVLHHAVRRFTACT